MIERLLLIELFVPMQNPEPRKPRGQKPATWGFPEKGGPSSFDSHCEYSTAAQDIECTQPLLSISNRLAELQTARDVAEAVLRKPPLPEDANLKHRGRRTVVGVSRRQSSLRYSRYWRGHRGHLFLRIRGGRCGCFECLQGAGSATSLLNASCGRGWPCGEPRGCSSGPSLG